MEVEYRFYQITYKVGTKKKQMKVYAINEKHAEKRAKNRLQSFYKEPINIIDIKPCKKVKNNEYVIPREEVKESVKTDFKQEINTKVKGIESKTKNQSQESQEKEVKEKEFKGKELKEEKPKENEDTSKQF